MPTRPKGFKAIKLGWDDDARQYNFERLIRLNPDSPWTFKNIYEEAIALEKVRSYELQSLDPATQLEQIAKEIHVRVKITQTEIFKIGELLYLAKAICQREKLRLQKWIKENCDFSYETANNFMHVYKCCIGVREIALTIKPSILYKLSSPGFPEELRQYLFTSGHLQKLTNGKLTEVVKKFEKGGFAAIESDVERITHEQLIKNQVRFTLDKCMSSLSTLQDLEREITSRGHNIFLEDDFERDAPEARDINRKLHAAVQKGIIALNEALRESFAKLADSSHLSLNSGVFRKAFDPLEREREEKKLAQIELEIKSRE